MRYDVDAIKVIKSFLTCIEDGVLVSHACIVYENAYVSDPQVGTSQHMFHNMSSVANVFRRIAYAGYYSPMVLLGFLCKVHDCLTIGHITLVIVDLLDASHILWQLVSDVYRHDIDASVGKAFRH